MKYVIDAIKVARSFTAHVGALNPWLLAGSTAVLVPDDGDNGLLALAALHGLPKLRRRRL